MNKIFKLVILNKLM